MEAEARVSTLKSKSSHSGEATFMRSSFGTLDDRASREAPGNHPEEHLAETFVERTASTTSEKIKVFHMAVDPEMFSRAE